VRQLEEVLPGKISESHLGVVERALSAEAGRRVCGNSRSVGTELYCTEASPTKTFLPLNNSTAKEAKDDDQRTQPRFNSYYHYYLKWAALSTNLRCETAH
jgi:hypothetical protein